MRKDCQFKVIITEESPEILAYIDLCRHSESKIQISSVLVYALSVYFETEKMPIVAAVCRERCYDVLDGRKEMLGFRYKSFANKNQAFFRWMETAESSVIRSLVKDAIQVVETFEEEYCREASELKKLGIHHRLAPQNPVVQAAEERTNERFITSRERFKANEGRISETFRKLGLDMTSGMFNTDARQTEPSPEVVIPKQESPEQRRKKAEEDRLKDVDSLINRIENWTASSFDEE